VRKYVLGTKFVIYKDILGKNAIFDVPVLGDMNEDQGLLPFTDGEKEIIKNIKGFSNLIPKGWTFSYISGEDDVEIRLISNIDENTDSKLIIHLINSDNNDTTVYFENKNFVPTPDRYYLTEVQLSRPMSTTTSTIYMNDASIGDVKKYEFKDQTFAYEYYYNKSSLEFIFDFKQEIGASFSISKLAVYETDSIPFFKYYKTDSEIDLSIKNPYIGSAPVIDYTNKNFDFIGNVELGIDYRTIVQQNSFSSNQSGVAQLARYNPVISGGPGTE
jgi:hypothetical protein